jgi:DNA-binding MarR family transcriptional regulator
MPSPRPKVTKSHYETLAALRHALRAFLRFSETAAAAAGLTAQQHQAMLAIKGFAGRDRASIGEIAQRLHLLHHSAVGLIDRLEKRQLVRRVPSRADRRRVDILLTARGEALLEKLSAAHLAELRQHGPELHRLLGAVVGK